MPTPAAPDPLAAQRHFVRFMRFVHPFYRFWLRLARPLTVGVRVLLAHDDQVLLVRHSYQPGWLLPGGGVKRGETLDEAARREIREEVDLELGELRLLGVYTNLHEYKSDHVTVFATRAFDPAALRIDQLEISAAQFFPITALPDELLPGHRRRIQEWAAEQPTAHFGRW